jgi:hypothetical protein
MANTFYPFGLAEIMRGNIDLLADDIRVIFIDAGAEPYNAADQDIADIGAGAMVGDGGGDTGADGIALANKTISDIAEFDSDPALFTSVTGIEFEGVLIYKWTGTAGTSTLIARLDDGTDMIQTPDGGNIQITPGSYWFKINPAPP